MKDNDFTISGNIIDVVNREIYTGTLIIRNGRIADIIRDNETYMHFILPGFIDAHIHIESSMLTPYEFARVALKHGTVATVSDPHEIANVCGLEGVYYMLEHAKEAKLKFHFGAPSCVPATSFETSGAILDAEDVEVLLKRDDIFYLSEMMNYPGVLFNDPEVMKKIALAKKYSKPIDGHAPGLRGDDAENYIKAGITTDHECFTKDEAIDKIKHGMKILIREGSAAKNFEALHELISEYPDMAMLCSDDKHPDDLITGHIDQLVKRAIQKGHQLMDVLQAACVNPVQHYHLRVGLLQKNDLADFIIVENLETFKILETIINGEKVVEKGECILPPRKHKLINSFSAVEKKADDFNLPPAGKRIKVIVAKDGQLITEKAIFDTVVINNNVVSDIQHDVLKIAVVNRYKSTNPAISFIKNFGIKKGAFASTVAHDSHNIIAVGTNDHDLEKVVNLLVKNKGGLGLVYDGNELILPLPIAGLMTDKTCEEAAEMYALLSNKVKELGCNLHAPYMTLSFMALLVIPDLKLSDKGLFEGSTFGFTDLFVNE